MKLLTENIFSEVLLYIAFYGLASILYTVLHTLLYINA